MLAKKARDFFYAVYTQLDSYLDSEGNTPEICNDQKMATVSQTNNNNFVPISQRARRSFRKDPNAPKRPLNSFLLYCRFRREQLSQQGICIFYLFWNRLAIRKDKQFQILGEEWSKLQESDKAVWVEKARKLKLRHLMALDEYNNKPMANTDTTKKQETPIEKGGSKTEAQASQQQKNLEEEITNDNEDTIPIFKLITDSEPQTPVK